MGKKKSKVIPFRQKSVAKGEANPSKIDISASSTGRLAALDEVHLRLEVERIVCRGTVRETWHSKNDRSYRNVSMDDIQHMLRNAWKLKGKPAWDTEHANWKYKVVGEDIDDEELTLVITVNANELFILVITKF